MRILVVNAAIVPPSHPGGTRHYMLAKYLRGRHTLSLVASNRHYANLTRLYNVEGTMERIRVDGVEIYVVKGQEFSGRPSRRLRIQHWFSFALRAFRLLDELPRPDVIVGSSPNLVQALVAELYARRRGIPYVLEIRDFWPEVLIGLGGFSRRNPFVLLLGAIERYLYRRAQAVITLMDGAQAMLVKKGALSERIFVVSNGVDFDLVDAPSPPVSIGDETFNVLYAGSHGISNALDALLDAASLVWKRGYHDIRFVLMGDGEFKRRLVKRVEDEGIQNVVFHNPVPKNKIYAYLRAADALVVNALNSPLYDYGVSFNKIFDYMASARPSIFAVHSTIMEDAQGGITCLPNDSAGIAEAAIQLYKMSSEQRQAMGLRARAYVKQHYDMEILARKFEEAVYAALGGK